MKKALIVLLLIGFVTGLWADAPPRTMTRIVYRELPLIPTVNLPSARTAWVAGDKLARIKFPPEPAQTGFWVSIINFPDKWYVNEALQEGNYWKDDKEALGYYPLGYSDVLKKMTFGKELSFIQEHGFSNLLTEVDGVLCDAWDAFIPGYLVTLYVNHETGQPLQLEARRDSQPHSLLRKIRYDEYEAGIQFDASLFESPKDVTWLSSNMPPAIFTTKTNFLNWARFYYQSPDPEKIPEALAYINYYKYDFWSSAALLSILFRDNPKQGSQWIEQTELFQKSAREACLYALWLANTEWGNDYLKKIADDSERRDHEHVSSLLKKNRYAITDLPITSSAIANMHMHAFFMTGDLIYIDRLLYSMEGFSKGKESKEYNAATQAITWLISEAQKNEDISARLKIGVRELPEKLQPLSDVLLGALEEPYDPLPIPTNTLLMAEPLEQCEISLWRTLLHKLWTNSSLVSSEEISLFINQYSQNLAQFTSPRRCDLRDSTEQLKEMSETWMNQGESNVVVQFAYAEMTSRPVRGNLKNEKTTRLLQDVFAALENEPGPQSLIPFLCADRLLRHHSPYNKKGPSDSAKTWHTNAMNSLLNLLKYGGFKDEQIHIPVKYTATSFATYRSKQNPANFYSALMETELDPWLKNTVAGIAKIREAWNARGGGWSDTVTRDMRAEFKGYLWEARQHLTKAWELNPNRPESCSEMITVCMGEGKDSELRKWFDRAVQTQMDYLPAYSGYKLAVLPRWGGSHAKMYRFATECLETRCFDTAVPELYIGILEAIGRETDDLHALNQTYTNLYPQILEYYENISEGTGLSYTSPFWLGLYAWGARDYPTARDAFSRTKDIKNISDIVLNRFGGADNIVGESWLGASSLGKKFEQVRALALRRKFNDAITLCLEIPDDSSLDTKYAKPFVLSQIETLRIKAGLESREWFRFMPPEDMAGWSSENCRWEYDEAGWLQGLPTSRYTRLFCDVSVGDNFELKGELDTSEISRLGILFGYSEKLGEQYFSFRVTKKDAGLFRKIDEKGKKYLTNVTVPGTNTFHLQVWNKKVTAYLNGKQIFKNEPLQKDGWGRGVGLVGLGDYYFSYDGKVMRYRNLEMRRLKRNPNASEETLAQEIFQRL